MYLWEGERLEDGFSGRRVRGGLAAVEMPQPRHSLADRRVRHCRQVGSEQAQVLRRTETENNAMQVLYMYVWSSVRLRAAMH